MSLHTSFIDFCSKITISDSKKDSIIKSRNAIKNVIRNYFKNELKINQPKFRIQGSFSINTALQPIDDNEVDIDDGLYLEHINPSDTDTWPTPKEIHKTLMDALDGQTKDGCEDKTSCVRVVYRNDYHVDIPVYIMKNSHALLANKKANEWQTSDSKDFKDWFFENRKNEQTTRIVKYLKAWRDYKNINMASIELTILAVKHHVKDDDDAISLQKTVDAIYSELNFFRYIKKPVAPYENLWEDKDDIDSVLKKIKQFKDDLNSAVSNDSEHRASVILREQFGDRFPLIKEINNSDSLRNYETGPKPWKK